mmetsp:Transcript_20062/g.63067  ORF Transcript_20062/g.63067 Transcript_20062/m.63067 type:complete len:751 (-) Transcript_20062:554-2806(-)
MGPAAVPRLEAVLGRERLLAVARRRSPRRRRADRSLPGRRAPDVLRRLEDADTPVRRRRRGRRRRRRRAREDAQLSGRARPRPAAPRLGHPLVRHRRDHRPRPRPLARPRGLLRRREADAGAHLRARARRRPGGARRLPLPWTRRPRLRRHRRREAPRPRPQRRPLRLRRPRRHPRVGRHDPRRDPRRRRRLARRRQRRRRRQSPRLRRHAADRPRRRQHRRHGLRPLRAQPHGGLGLLGDRLPRRPRSPQGPSRPRRRDGRSRRRPLLRRLVVLRPRPPQAVRLLRPEAPRRRRAPHAQARRRPPPILHLRRHRLWMARDAAPRPSTGRLRRALRLRLRVLLDAQLLRLRQLHRLRPRRRLPPLLGLGPRQARPKGHERLRPHHRRLWLLHPLDHGRPGPPLPPRLELPRLGGPRRPRLEPPPPQPLPHDEARRLRRLRHRPHRELPHLSHAPARLPGLQLAGHLQVRHVELGKRRPRLHRTRRLRPALEGLRQAQSQDRQGRLDDDRRDHQPLSAVGWLVAMLPTRLGPHHLQAQRAPPRHPRQGPDQDLRVPCRGPLLLPRPPPRPALPRDHHQPVVLQRRPRRLLGRSRSPHRLRLHQTGRIRQRRRRPLVSLDCLPPRGRRLRRRRHLPMPPRDHLSSRPPPPTPSPDGLRHARPRRRQESPLLASRLLPLHCLWHQDLRPSRRDLLPPRCRRLPRLVPPPALRHLRPRRPIRLPQHRRSGRLRLAHPLSHSPRLERRAADLSPF